MELSKTLAYAKKRIEHILKNESNTIVGVLDGEDGSLILELSNGNNFHLSSGEVEYRADEYKENKKWVHDIINRRVIDTNDENCVFYTTELTCEDNVIDNVVMLYNTNEADGIDGYLLEDERCTQDDRELILENIAKFLKYHA